MDRINDAYNGLLGEEMQTVSRERIHWLCENINGDNVLDIGCSQGICDILLGRGGVHAFGIDADEEAISVALKALKEQDEKVQNLVRFDSGIVPGYDLKDEKFDTIIISEIIEHLIQPERFINYLKDYLTPNGRFLVTVPFGINPYPDHKKTYYLTNLLNLFEENFKISSVNFFTSQESCWIGLIADLSKPFGISEKMYRETVEKAETAFNVIDSAKIATKKQLFVCNESLKQERVKFTAKETDFLKIIQNMSITAEKNIQYIQAAHDFEVSAKNANYKLKITEEKLKTAEKNLTRICDRLENTWYGRLGMFMFHLLKGIKDFFSGKKE